MVNKLVIKFKDGSYTNIDCAEMHDNDGIIKVYNAQCMLIALFDEKEIKAAYISRKERE